MFESKNFLFSSKIFRFNLCGNSKNSQWFSLVILSFWIRSFLFQFYESECFLHNTQKKNTKCVRICSRVGLKSPTLEQLLTHLVFLFSDYCARSTLIHKTETTNLTTKGEYFFSRASDNLLCSYNGPALTSYVSFLHESIFAVHLISDEH